MIDFSRFRSEIVSCSALAAFPLGNRFLLGARGISARKSFPARRSRHFRSEISFCSALVAFPLGNFFLLGARGVSAWKSFPARRSSYFRKTGGVSSRFLFVCFIVFIVFLWFCIFLWPRKLRTIHFRFRKEFCFDCKCTENSATAYRFAKEIDKILTKFPFSPSVLEKMHCFCTISSSIFSVSLKSSSAERSTKKTGSLATPRPAVLSRMICVYSLLPRLLNTSAPSFSSTTMWLSRLTVPARICFDRSLSR